MVRYIILDVSSGSEEYIFKDKKCYTYELRYALEEYDTAREIGEFMVDSSADFTYSHNIYLADGKETFCAEDATAQLRDSGNGFSMLRDSDTPLMERLHWDSPDSLCVVNSFASKGNFDEFDGHTNNYVRFFKYNEWISARDKFSVGQLKSALSQEFVNQGNKDGEASVDNVRSKGTSQIIIIDYHTGNMQVCFTSHEGPSDDVIFTDVGNY